MEFQEALALLKVELESPTSNNALSCHAIENLRKLTSELIASGRAAKAKHAGDTAPSFRLPAANGEMVGVPGLGDAPLVIVFLNGGWCPFCNLELRALEEFHAVAKRLGARLVAVSADSVEGNRRATDEMALTFPLLSDREGRVSKAFGLRYDLPAEVADIYRNHFGASFARKRNAEWLKLPMHARYVVDRGCRIVFSEVDADFARRPEPSELVPVLEHLGRHN